MKFDGLPDPKELVRLEKFLAALRRAGVMEWTFADGQKVQLGPLPAAAPALTALPSGRTEPDGAVVKAPEEPEPAPSTLEHVMLVRGLPRVG